MQAALRSRAQPAARLAGTACRGVLGDYILYWPRGADRLEPALAGTGNCLQLEPALAEAAAIPQWREPAAYLQEARNSRAQQRALQAVGPSAKPALLGWSMRQPRLGLALQADPCKRHKCSN